MIAASSTMLFALLFLILLDFITGFRKSRVSRNVKWNPFAISFWRVLHSKGMRDTWRKTYEYLIGIIVLTIVQCYLLNLDPFTIMEKKYTLTQIGIVIGSIVEVWSIFENMEAVSGNNLLKRISFLFPDNLKKFLKIKDNGDKSKIEERN
jgi:hypothetical protein